MIESAITWLLGILAAPEVGLTSVFIISFVSATLVPLGSEPAVFAVCKANGDMFWPAIAVATVGNTHLVIHKSNRHRLTSKNSVNFQ
jgi:membrane protein YqaA with SNARE-associated domain